MHLFKSSSFVCVLGAVGESCTPRYYGKSSFVCVCNAYTCDKVPSVGHLAAGEAVVMSSSRSEARFRTMNLTFSHHSNTLLGIYLKIYFNVLY